MLNIQQLLNKIGWGQKEPEPSASDLDCIKGKVVLITGGTGSLGHALTKRICDHAAKVIIYSRCELKQDNMRQKFLNYKNIRYFLGDVKNKDRLLTALRGVDVCIHAACYKRVESCSFNPVEAVHNNISGSINVLEACIENNVKKSLMISTDKASSPVTLYGGTKFVSEQLFINGNNYSSRESTLFTVVRYGNVFGSNGSMKHLFAKQAQDSGKILITHPEMTRFFMTLDEACDLILFALTNAVGGEIFVPKMKATQIIRYAQLFYPQVPTEIIGLRAYEKIHEELISEAESNCVADCGDKYYKIIPPFANIPGFGWDLKYPAEPLLPPFKYTSDCVQQFSDQELLDLEKQYGG